MRKKRKQRREKITKNTKQCRTQENHNKKGKRVHNFVPVDKIVQEIKNKKIIHSEYL
jgi:hypothetical protein